MDEMLKNKKMCMRGYWLMIISIGLAFLCILSRWMAIPCLGVGVVGGAMMFIAITRESKRQIKELLDEYKKNERAKNNNNG